MMQIDREFLKSCEKFDPSMTEDEYCLAVNRYIRMIWDDSRFPEKELSAKRDLQILCYRDLVPVSKAANQITDRIQEELADPATEAVLDELFRREAEQRERLERSQKKAGKVKKA